MRQTNVRGILLTSAWSAAFVVMIGVTNVAVAQTTNSTVCGQIGGPGQIGPFDYRSAGQRMEPVLSAHFTPEVEALQHGHAGYLGGDLDYTLRAIPNNPRALLAMARYAIKTKSERPPDIRWPVECYFERGTRFAPDDPMPHLVWAIYLKDRKRMPEAKVHVDQAEALRGEPTNFDLDYNIGLLYFELGAYDRSLAAATRAYALGAPLPALRNKLQRAGKWQEPTPQAAAPPAAAPPVAAEAEPAAK